MMLVMSLFEYKGGMSCVGYGAVINKNTEKETIQGIRPKKIDVLFSVALPKSKCEMRDLFFYFYFCQIKIINAGKQNLVVNTFQFP